MKTLVLLLALAAVLAPATAVAVESLPDASSPQDCTGPVCDLVCDVHARVLHRPCPID